jgi:crotonobetainyl-CoA:carnitine CoA-transferase CaiB-like acyl-CoA transferase
LSVTGTPDSPSKAGNSIADIAAGMYAYSNILAALLQRQKTGLGSSIDVSMLESLSEWMSYPMYYAYQDASPPQRSGAAHATIYPYGPFKAGDGATIMLGLQNEREWLAFCEMVLDNPGLASDVRFDKNSKRHEHRDALATLIETCFSKLTSEQVIAKLDQAQIANARLNDMSGVWNHPQLAARDRWVSVNSPAGPIPALLPPGANDQFDYRMDAIPSVGQHTDAILAEIGLNQDQISAMKASKAI